MDALEQMTSLELAINGLICLALGITLIRLFLHIFPKKKFEKTEVVPFDEEDIFND